MDSKCVNGIDVFDMCFMEEPTGWCAPGHVDPEEFCKAVISHNEELQLNPEDYPKPVPASVKHTYAKVEKMMRASGGSLLQIPAMNLTLCCILATCSKLRGEDNGDI